MPLFQNSVVTKQLQSQEKTKLVDAWNVFKNHFHNPTIQDNIRSSKEEQYQGEFLIDLFVNVLGYTKNPTPNFTITTEYKNVKDSKKADGAILIPSPTMGLNPLVKAVIELKGTNTTDLNKIEVQAFGYKNNQPDCVYVITSNFEKVRFYIDNATEHIEFNLFNLTEKEFELLYLCLAYENIANDIPKKLKEQSVSQEKDITKKLYTDYSLFKRELHQDLVKQNPESDAVELFQKSQKLLDRFLFIFFAEDRNLLPTNLIFRINKEWRQLQEMRMNISLYDRYKIYFNDLNKGAKVVLPAFTETTASQKEEHQIFAYNGGLFQSDEILDNITIDDELLYKHTHKLSHYDFASEVDVNILGHIFENSLNELDEIKAQLEGGIVDKSSTKRKKDGVFYTPKYITKYIVDNTIGKLCTDKKAELNIVEEEYISNKGFKPLAKKTKQPLLEKLTTYRNWLLQITICDPACGSGAFLNQALDFLISEHRYIDELQAKLFGDALILSDVEKSILENNLYGVDLNEESVEIAKLSLWLRTAQPNRKLNDLNNNIKCGNSLIDDVAIAGDKAFNWQTTFNRIFKEKNKKAFHLVFTTHNSRVSQRMIDYKVKKGPALELNLEEEIELTKIFKQIIFEKNYNCLAYNICKDHIHIIVVCEEEEVTNIAKTLKGRSSFLYQSNGFKPIGEPLWSQKFFFADLNELIWGDISPKQGYIQNDTYIDNAIAYIKTNREKHQLPNSKELKSIINQFVVDLDVAFATEYSGGFDVIIGNPPYGAKLDAVTQNYLNKKYIKGGSETVISFTKLCYDNLLKTKGNFGFIIPKSFTFSSNYESIREYVFDDISEIIDCKKVWKEVLLEQVIFFFTKNNKTQTYKTGKLKGQDVLIIGDINKENFSEFGFYLNDISNEELNIALKIKKSKFYIKDIAKNSRGGIFQNKISENGNIEVLGGAEIQRNGIIGIKGKIDIKQIENDAKCFINKNSVLVQRLIAHIENPNDHIKITACMPERNDIAIVDTINQITFDEKFDAKVFWCLFNSKLINWYCYRFILARAIRTMQFDNPITNRIPIPVDFNQKPFIEKADLMLSLNKDLQEQSQKFLRTIKRKFFSTIPMGLNPLENKPLKNTSMSLNPLENNSLETNLPKKLQDWYLLSYADFIKELGKLKIKLTLSQEAEWEDYFTNEATKVTAIKAQIETTDKAIDYMVYELYELSKEEIEIVENS
jgi:type I restriction-modification system DNA methylase subunit/REP element-mobilizing transposase RayT